MSRGSRAVAAAVAAVVLVSPAFPGPAGEPARRLVNAEPDGRDPQWPAELDGVGLRQAGARLPDDTTYALDARGADPVVQGSLKAGAQLFLAPALPVRDPATADWIVRYRSGALAVEERR